MESLSEEVWDVVIAGTSLSQSLLALALSKCNVKVLHVDKNEYYGGTDAGLSLEEAEKWIKTQKNHANVDDSSTFAVSKSDAASTLGSSRAYTIGLSPQIIYAKSTILPTLVSSQIHTQLEFQAVGAFFVYADGKLQKIPSNREDVFADDSLSIRDKRKLMNLLRYVVEDKGEVERPIEEPTDLSGRLQAQFKLPPNLIAPIQALALATDLPQNISFAATIARLRRHLMSMGYFGPGLAAVMAKYGGNAEIAQVACRAGAVGGFVYLLGHGVTSVDQVEDGLLQIELSEGTKVKARHVVGTLDDLPSNLSRADTARPPSIAVAHSVSIVSSLLKHLFTPTSENSNIPAVVIILVNDDSTKPPVYLQVHSEDTGECPAGQCTIHASTAHADEESHQRLAVAAASILATDEANDASVLWSMNYIRHLPAQNTTGSLLSTSKGGKVLLFPDRIHSLAFDDAVLDDVKAAWEAILGDRSKEYDFLRFEQGNDDNDD